MKESNRLMRPVKYKADVEELVYDENSKPVLDEMGKQKKKIVNREFQSFRPAYVFDVQQTSGEPLPTLAGTCSTKAVRNSKISSTGTI